MINSLNTLIREAPNGFRFVNGRDIHEYVGSKIQYSIWIRPQIAKLSLIDGRDFNSFTVKGHVGRPRVEYVFTVFAAKRIITSCDIDIQSQLIREDELWNNPYAILIRASQVHRGYKQL